MNISLKKVSKTFIIYIGTSYKDSDIQPQKKNWFKKIQLNLASTN